MLVLLALVSFSESYAAEVQFEGFYRARFRAFDTLSLDRDNPLSEGLAAYGQHRLWLKPSFLLSDEVQLFVEIRGLDGVSWGANPAQYDPVFAPPPHLSEYALQSPAGPEASPSAFDLTLWRAWGRVYTGIGHFTFGRMPLHWGLGVWQNDGLSVAPMYADYGDTTDRVMWEHLIQDQFYLRANVDVPVERFIGEIDDTTAYGVGAAYKSEELTAGILLQLDHTGRRLGLGALNVFTADMAADVTLGRLDVATEIIGQFGGGDLEGGINDASITAFGGALEAGLTLDLLTIEATGGLATGDGQNDLNLRSFTFDRDYSVGMFLFEQPMPILATTPAAANATNGGRDFASVATQRAVSNALFFKPGAKKEIVDGFWVSAAWLTARVAKSPPQVGVRGYGNEFQLGAAYTGIEHFDIDGRVGLFLPGSVYSVAQDGFTPLGFRDPAFGFQLTGRIKF